MNSQFLCDLIFIHLPYMPEVAGWRNWKHKRKNKHKSFTTGWIHGTFLHAKSLKSEGKVVMYIYDTCCNVTQKIFCRRF